MTHALVLLLALLLDGMLGDPDAIWRRFPHPVVWLGRIIGWLDLILNRGKARRPKGVMAVVIFSALALAAGWFLSLHWLVELVVVAVLLAHTSLCRHVGAVATALKVGLPEGRIAVGKIVGRDPMALDESGVARAAIESAAENFSDGVIAPAFWFLLAGVPGILLYKTVNTADSMIGYRSDKYREFGWAAARLDDLMNWVPARLSAVIISTTSFSLTAFAVMWRDARLHRSPNAGWPEAAMAAVLGVSLAGPRAYDGVMTKDALVNETGRRKIGAPEISQAVAVLWRSWGGLLLILLVVVLYDRT